jgi:class 3 adenylate cyclase
VVRAYQETEAEVIQQYDGHIAQYLGDGLLVYFGWPRAHEDDAQRALYSGLGIVEAITMTLNPRLQQDKGVQLSVRLGVHTGPVVVGEMGGGIAWRTWRQGKPSIWQRVWKGWKLLKRPA